MSALLEFKAKNVDKAVEKASAELKLPKEKIKYEVLSYGSSGIFGLSRTKKAKIRVKLPEDSPDKEPQPQSAEFHTEAPPAPDASNPSEATDAVPVDEDWAIKNNSEAQQAYSFPDEAVEIGRLVLKRIVDTITADANISVEENAERLCFNVNGGNAGILIGKRGQTLDAIHLRQERCQAIGDHLRPDARPVCHRQPQVPHDGARADQQLLPRVPARRASDGDHGRLGRRAVRLLS